MHVLLVTQMVTNGWWLLVLMMTVNYGHLFLGRRSSVRGLSAGSVYFGSPGWIWEYLFRGAGCHPFSGCSCDDSDVISSSVYFGTLGSDWWLYIPQMVMISSETRFSTDDQRAWRMATHCIHSSASLHLALIASNTCLSICRDIFDWDSGWETSWCQNVIVKLLSVSMKLESKDRMFLIRIDIAFMHES